MCWGREGKSHPLAGGPCGVQGGVERSSPEPNLSPEYAWTFMLLRPHLGHPSSQCVESLCAQLRLVRCPPRGIGATEEFILNK